MMMFDTKINQKQSTRINNICTGQIPTQFRITYQRLLENRIGLEKEASGPTTVFSNRNFIITIIIDMEIKSTH